MPFTFSHPAVILPLAYVKRLRFSLTGLVAGSLTPDFEYFLRMKAQSVYSHTVDGLLWFDLPLGVLLAFIFHNIVRNALFDNLPFFLKSRFSAIRRLDWNEYFKKNRLTVIISTLIGAASHLLWDGFTHEQGCFVKIIPVLAGNVNLWNIQVPVFRVLQHSSTIVGGFAIVFAICRLPENREEARGVSAKYWLIAAVITLGVIGIRFLSGLELRQYGNVIVTVISAGLISLILTPWLMKTRNAGDR
jgi:hypothetical protein